MNKMFKFIVFLFQLIPSDDGATDLENIKGFVIVCGLRWFVKPTLMFKYLIRKNSLAFIWFVKGNPST